MNSYLSFFNVILLCLSKYAIWLTLISNYCEMLWTFLKINGLPVTSNFYKDIQFNYVWQKYTGNYGLMLQRGLCTCTIIPDVKSGCGILDNSYDKE